MLHPGLQPGGDPCHSSDDTARTSFPGLVHARALLSCSSSWKARAAAMPRGHSEAQELSRHCLDSALPTKVLGESPDGELCPVLPA